MAEFEPAQRYAAFSIIIEKQTWRNPWRAKSVHFQSTTHSCILSLRLFYTTPHSRNLGETVRRRENHWASKDKICKFFFILFISRTLKGHFARIGLTWVSFAGLRRVCFAALTRVYFPVLDGFILSVFFNGFSFSCLRRVYFAGLTRVYFS